MIRSKGYTDYRDKQAEADTTQNLRHPSPPPGGAAEVAGNLKQTQAKTSQKLPGIKHIIAIASGKGGVGKSTVTAALARAMAAIGLRVGVLDADIYGPSQPFLFGAEGYQPVPVDGSDNMIEPARIPVPFGNLSQTSGLKSDSSCGADFGSPHPTSSLSLWPLPLMSIGFFIGPDDALIWRGPMAVNALRQLARQTAWGELDVLLIDLPPGTGDVHLSVVHEVAIDGAVVVSTPGRLSVADVRRGVEMFRSDGINVPVLGVIENMAWFTPAELPDNKYFIFGKGEAREYAAASGIEFLGDIPIIMSADSSNIETPKIYHAIATRLTGKLFIMPS